MKVTRDLTERRNAEEALRQSEASLSATLYSIGDGVIATDERARVTRLNPVAERLNIEPGTPVWVTARCSGVEPLRRQA